MFPTSNGLLLFLWEDPALCISDLPVASVRGDVGSFFLRFLSPLFYSLMAYALEVIPSTLFRFARKTRRCREPELLIWAAAWEGKSRRRMSNPLLSSMLQCPSFSCTSLLLPIDSCSFQWVHAVRVIHLNFFSCCWICQLHWCPYFMFKRIKIYLYYFYIMFLYVPEQS